MRLTWGILLFAFAGLSSCSDCTDCTPFTEEPIVEVRFFNAADSSKMVIIIDSVNQVPAATLRHFQDTTYSFRFPLNMHEDISRFELVYRDTTEISGKARHNWIQFNYQRSIVRRQDNYIVTECSLQGLNTSFYLAELVCNEEDPYCISNESKTNIYN